MPARYLEKLETLGNLDCQFSKGESMEFELANWCTSNELLSFLESEIEKDSLFWGDIYIRFQS